MSQQITLNRRQLVAGIAGASALFVVGRSLTFAQAATLPSGEAAWPKFNLNSATHDQFSTIPTVGDKMLREFGEYKPYTSITQFRKEIGKYVDSDVVVGFEAYLFVPVDPNVADADTLQQLPGVDADKARALIAARPFADNAAFVTALGVQVSAEQAAAASQFLTGTATDVASWFKFDLNSATSEQFATIPGVGDKMLREFGEYKPYTTIAQFQKEIGKYVDADVVAGFEKYVFVPVDPNNADDATLQQLPGVSADKAKALSTARPYADASTFLTALAGQVSPDQAAAAVAFVAAS